MAVAVDYQTIFYKKQERAIPLGYQLGAAILLFIALSMKVWIQLECTEEGYKLSKERQKTIALDMQRRELELHRSILLKPDNLVMRSHKKLGLTTLNPSQAKKVYY